MIIAFFTFVVSGGAAVAAIVQARVAVAARDDALLARDESRVARDESVELAKRAVEATNRQADAQERLAAALAPKDGVVWELEHERGVLWHYRNVGNRIAENATLHEMGDDTGWVRREDFAPRNIAPNDILEFRIASASGSPNPRIQLRWREDDEPELLTFDQTIVP